MSSVEFRKDLFADERPENLNEIGLPKQRQDALGHVTGRSPYYDDNLYDGLLHMRMVRSSEYHARIRSISLNGADMMPGVVRVIQAADVPHNINTLLSLIGFGRDDEALLQDKKVSYRGEAILAIIAETELQARKACQAVRVDYEALPHVLDVEEALKPQAPVVNEEYPNNTFDYYDRYDHQKLRFGDPHAAMARADHIVEGEYQMSPIEQAPMETCGAIAVPETNDRILCHTCSQALFFSLGTTAKLLDTPSSRLHFKGGTVGGGFGGKVDSLNEPMAVLGAKLTGRPVKFTWDREEEMQVGAPRGAERWRIRDGVMNDGRIIAREFTGFFDSGAYTRLSSYAVVKGTAHLPGPYTIPNVASNVYCVFTNRTPATAMRGFGITGVDFAIECHMDKVAETVRMNPIELRLLNAYRDGDMKPHRRVAKNTAYIECCQVAAGKADWAIAPEYSAMSSLRDGGGERASIPLTMIDEEGRIGERKRGANIDTAPSKITKDSGRAPSVIPILEATQAMGEQAAGRPQVGKATSPAPQPSAPPAPAPAMAPSQTPSPTSAVPAAPQRSAFARLQASEPAAPSQSRPVEPQPSTPTPPSESEQPYRPSEPFSRGVKRPGASPFISGRRR
ncbi:xanthine dehydrogenase family protein molybdopterin-binding subunit [Ahrensia sp. R2A130]|uniref:xanthine dehydrogenase family protein molybdopterin-binding subunit n=1 Tax=Ahrensia sp. R2A130 TaxID=744979 RepID=UPI0001E0C386|nr:molybdopterin cofactor-binding domain-containing protein [Ahrensia sp. R2A130]EFL87825.1 dehydrogenase [Ahrensia sp. R2A130]